MSKLPSRLLLALLMCIVFIVIFGYIAIAIENHSIARFDTPLIEMIQGWETTWLTMVMKVVTWIGTVYGVGTIVVIGFIILSFKLRSRQQAFLLLGTVAGSIILNSLLKNVFQRDRPTINIILEASGHSYPSGHAMMALALYSTLAFIAWHYVKTTTSRLALILFAILMILLVGMSRIYLGAHYPSDIVGGYVASGLWVTIMFSIYTFFTSKRRATS